jgi:hypothetical protein
MIAHLDEVPVQGLSLNQAVEKMRGPENSKIKLKIMRKVASVKRTCARLQWRKSASPRSGDPGFSHQLNVLSRKLRPCTGLQPGSTARLLCDIFNSLNKEAYPFAAGHCRAGASDQSRGTPRLFDGRKIGNPNFCSIYLARRRQNNRTTSRAHFD